MNAKLLLPMLLVLPCVACGGATTRPDVVDEPALPDLERTRAEAMEQGAVVYGPNDPTHEHTGMVWPSSLLGASVGRVMRYDAEGYEMSAGYRSAEVNISIYVIPRAVDACPESAEEAVGMAAQVMLMTLQGPNDTFVSSFDYELLPGSTHAIGFNEPVAGNTVDRPSEAVGIWRWPEWDLKIRVSTMAGMDVPAADIVLVLPLMVQLPDFSSLPSHGLTQMDLYGEESECAFRPI